jgi:YVTN family beta-propeller protein
LKVYKSILYTFCFISCLNAFAQGNETGFKVLKKIKVPGDGHWDYVNFDNVNRRLYISHGTQVDVLDVDSEKVVGNIPNTPGVHGITLDYELNKGFTSNGKDSTVTVFDLKTLKVLDRIKVTGANPDAIIYEPYSRHVFTFNGGSDNATVIDPSTDKIIGTIVLGGKPEFPASNGRGQLYVNLEDKNETLEIDPEGLKVIKRWKLAPGEEPSGLSMDPATDRLFIGCANKKLVVLDTRSGRALNNFPIGAHVDATAFNPETKEILSSNGDGTLTVIKEENANTFKLLGNVSTQLGARTMALDIKKNRIYLPTAEFGTSVQGKNGKKRPSIVPGSFVILVVGKE